MCSVEIPRRRTTKVRRDELIPMIEASAGLHHVTAIAGDPKANLRFYRDILGLRLVKRTVNFDDTGTYHLYYGDERGTPGTILTFFPFPNAGPGQVGRGQVTTTAFTVPPGSLDFWENRLAEAGIEVEDPVSRFDERVIAFTDHEGQPLELVTGESDLVPWDDGPVPVTEAIRGFHAVTLAPTEPAATGRVLDLLGFERRAELDDRIRYEMSDGHGRIVDLDRTDGPDGRSGTGTVHHVAFRTKDDESQAAWRDRLAEAGLRPTPVKDRQYFRSIYFREPGGILFEIATDGPGFTRDEALDQLGSALKLPPWLEDDRDNLKSRLPPLDIDDAAIG